MKTIGIIQNVHQCVYQHFWNFEYTRKMAELEGGYFSPELNGHPVYMYIYILHTCVHTKMMATN